jgi:hypothetical protein
MQQLVGSYADIPERNMLAGAYEDVFVAGRHSKQAIPATDIEFTHTLVQARGMGHSKLRAERAGVRPPDVDRIEIPRHRPAPPEVEYNVTVIVPTLLENLTHTIIVTKFTEPKPIPGFPRPPPSGAERTTVTVSGGRVALADVPARNGAVHVVDQLLNPLRGHKHHEHEKEQGDACQVDEWEDWEDWLPQWAEA